MSAKDKTMRVSFTVDLTVDINDVFDKETKRDVDITEKNFEEISRGLNGLNPRYEVRLATLNYHNCDVFDIVSDIKVENSPEDDDVTT